MFTLRPYQDEAVEAVIKHFKLSEDPACVVAATGAGKSLIIAAVAEFCGTALVLHPSKELVAQNAAKYAAYGLDNHSIYCAGLNEKSLEGDVIFASHQSIADNIDAIPEIKVLIVDEAHKFSAAFAILAAELKKRFPGLWILGLTATPYLMGKGYIYRVGVDGRTKTDEEARDPYFVRCVYEIGPERLIAEGYLSPLVFGTPDIKYDSSKLVIQPSGYFSADSIERATTHDRNATARIARQLIDVLDRERTALMVFCASIEHAKVFMEHMPDNRARLITGSTPTAQRARYLKAFGIGMFDVLVNVATLTTGVDLPIVDLIGILRPTESASLWQQIAGRGMRLFPDKADCAIYDYTENIPTFFPSGNPYRPEIQAVKQTITETMPVECPTCGYENTFKLARNEMGLPVSADGYFCDLTNAPVVDDNGQKLIAHHGRRCQHIAPNGFRCTHRFVAKTCPKCGEDNDIAARKCNACSAPLVDWNRHLKSLAARLPTVESRVGDWTIGRVENVGIEYIKNMVRAAFFVSKRPKPIRKWLQGTPTVLSRLKAEEKPHAVAFRKNARGQDDVRVLWTPLDLDQFMERGV